MLRPRGAPGVSGPWAAGGAEARHQGLHASSGPAPAQRFGSHPPAGGFRDSASEAVIQAAPGESGSKARARPGLVGSLFPQRDQLLACWLRGGLRGAAGSAAGPGA